MNRSIAKSTKQHRPTCLSFMKIFNLTYIFFRITKIISKLPSLLNVPNCTQPRFEVVKNLRQKERKGTPGFICCSFKSGAFLVLKGIYQNIFLQVPLIWCYLPELVLDLMISKFVMYTKNEDDLSPPAIC